MANPTHPILSLLRLSRPAMMPALVSGPWMMVFLAFGVEPAERRNPALDELGLWLALLCTAGIAWGLGVFMVALNDTLDARHDRAFEPDRPIPAGRVTQRAALALSLAGLLAALGASVPLGKLSMLLALTAAGAIVFYNVAGRFVPAVGVVTLGLILGLTLVIPNPGLAFAWPITLTMTHVIAAATIRYWLAGKRPRLNAINGWGICVGWVFWSLVVIVLIRVRGRDVVHDGLTWVWLGPAVAAVGLSLLTWLLLGPSALHPKARRGTAARFTHLAAAWLILFHAAWLVSAGLWWQGLVVLALLAINIWFAGLQNSGSARRD